jgi:hypothetical protein
VGNAQQSENGAKEKQWGRGGDVKRWCNRRVFVAFAKRSGELEESKGPKAANYMYVK